MKREQAAKMVGCTATPFILLFWLPVITSSSSSLSVCIVGSGIGGSSVAHFLREYSSPSALISIHVFERDGVVGGRMARVKVGGDSFEAGGSVLHRKNYHVLNYTKLIGLKIRWSNATLLSDGRDNDGGFGIWDGKSFVFKMWRVSSKLPFVDKIVSFANTALLFWRYGFSLIRMDNFAQRTVNNLLKYYEINDSRRVFETVNEMLKWAGLYNLNELPYVGNIVSLIGMDKFVQRTVNNLLKYYESTDSRMVFEKLDQMLKWAGLHNVSKLPFVDKIVSFANTALLYWRYGFSLVRMDNFVQRTVNNFLKYYESTDSRPVFETVEEMLKWAGLYNLTGHTLEEDLVSIGLSPLLIRELITVITRVNYGQSVSISGLAGAVSLAGSRGDSWSVQEGNWQMPAGLLNHWNVALHLREEIESISNLGNYYELNSSQGNSYKCEVAVVATPLDEVDIRFDPPVSIPPRKLQHTHATFVRGLLNPAYFGLASVEEIPELVGAIEDPGIPFSSISVLKRHDENEATYKVFSHDAMLDTSLDQIFSVRKETIRINWGAYPHYKAPEVFAPFILDGQHLYYVNAFENAASTMEMSAIAAENVARLILSRHFGHVPLKLSGSDGSKDDTGLHLEL